ncbi:hypothetical protein IWQ62_004058 [Dispira parvispora]|uniref:Uncharacterized protein n=1 Tax=Dispira parvispora TaxID=1520584 RepID=A0A9W8APS5_9FUNG|nr:hypothetical protein IWQ62_004058 [Dispira parvispora]
MSGYSSYNYSEGAGYGSQGNDQKKYTQADSTGYAPAGYNQGAYVSSTAKPPPPSGGSYSSQHQYQPPQQPQHSGSYSSGYGDNAPGYSHNQSQGYNSQEQPPAYGSHHQDSSSDQENKPPKQDDSSHDGWKTAGAVAAGVLATGAAIWAGKELYDKYEEHQDKKKPVALGPNEPRMPDMPSRYNPNQQMGGGPMPSGGGYPGQKPQYHGGGPYRSAERDEF